MPEHRTETAGKVIESIVKEFRELKENLVPAEELRRAKDHLKGSFMLGLESTSSRMGNLARQEMYFKRFFTLDEMLQSIEDVTAEQVQRIAQEFFDPQEHHARHARQPGRLQGQARGSRLLMRMRRDKTHVLSACFSACRCLPLRPGSEFAQAARLRQRFRARARSAIARAAGSLLRPSGAEPPAFRWRMVTIDSLDGEPIEDVANSLYRKWGVGKKGKDEGIMLLLAVKDHRDRIEVGYGLEPILPDGFDGSVLRQARPLLRQGAYGQAIFAAAGEMGSRIAAREGRRARFLAARARGVRRRPTNLPFGAFIVIAIIIVVLLSFLRRGGGGGGGGFLDRHDSR